MVLHDLLGKLAAYQQEPVYQIVQRFFDENFKVGEQQVKAKSNTEIQPGCLQSLDDVEASYRKKGNRSYKGYVANLTETCSEENPLQLITQVQVEPNRISDNELLKSGGVTPFQWTHGGLRVVGYEHAGLRTGWVRDSRWPSDDDADCTSLQ